MPTKFFILILLLAAALCDPAAAQKTDSVPLPPDSLHFLPLDPDRVVWGKLEQWVMLTKKTREWQKVEGPVRVTGWGRGKKRHWEVNFGTLLEPKIFPLKILWVKPEEGLPRLKWGDVEMKLIGYIAQFAAGQVYDQRWRFQSPDGDVRLELRTELPSKK